MDKLCRSAKWNRTGNLSSRERKIAPLLVKGMSDKEIARALGRSRSTISNQVSTLRSKIDAGNRTEAAVKLQGMGFRPTVGKVGRVKEI